MLYSEQHSAKMNIRHNYSHLYIFTIIMIEIYHSDSNVRVCGRKAIFSYKRHSRKLDWDMNQGKDHNSRMKKARTSKLQTAE